MKEKTLYVISNFHTLFNKRKNKSTEKHYFINFITLELLNQEKSRNCFKTHTPAHPTKNKNQKTCLNNIWRIIKNTQYRVNVLLFLQVLCYWKDTWARCVDGELYFLIWIFKNVMNFRVIPSFTQVTYRKYRNKYRNKCKSHKQGFHLIYLLNNKFNVPNKSF